MAGTNVVQPDRRDSVSGWLGPAGQEQRSRRWKLIRSARMGEGWRPYVSASQDGFHWLRANYTGLQSDANDLRLPFIKVSEQRGDWNWGNVQSAGGGCLVVGDRLYFYCSGRAGVPGTPESGVCTTGLATLRRDGFAPMIATEQAGTLTTRPVRFSGRHLSVNVDASGGEFRVEARHPQGRVIPSFGA